MTCAFVFQNFQFISSRLCARNKIELLFWILSKCLWPPEESSILHLSVGTGDVSVSLMAVLVWEALMSADAVKGISHKAS